MADITELQPSEQLNATENKALISPAVLEAQSNSGPPGPASTGLFDPQVAIAQSASNTEPNEFNTPAEGGTVSSAVLDAQSASNTDTVGFTSPMYGTSYGAGYDPITGTLTGPNTYQPTLPNPLHNYVNYTYSISLHLLTERGYQAAGNYIPDGENSMGSVLIASGGKYDNGSMFVSGSFARNSSFKEDFFFDELKFITVINTTPRSRNSNAVDINFTVIEPNGFTLVNRLLEACTKIGSKNYLSQPYLLQIDFYGNDDYGMPSKILDHSKKIPIKLVGMKSRITARGTEYRIQAVPFNHTAFSESIARTPANFQIKANSLTTFFGSGSSNSIVDLAGRDIVDDTYDPDLNANSRDASGILTTTQASNLLNNTKLDAGYVNAMNTWSQYLVTSNNRKIADQFEVKFAPEILAQQSMVDKKRNATLRVADKGVENDKAQPDWSQQYFSVSASTSIETVIEMAMRNSEYILNQITDPSTDAPESIAQRLGKSLNWFKIIPKIELIGWDERINDYAKKITYHVKSWTVSNIHPNGPLGKPRGAVKEYNYLYTGKNDDILDLSIDFDMQYYVQMTVDRNKQQDNLDLARNDRNDKEASQSQIPTPGVVNPIRYVHQAQDIQQTGQFGSSDTPKKQQAADVNRNLTSTSRGDMINVKMRIIGDPHFIKQDDLFLNQDANKATGVLVNNSLVMDSSELYVLVKFNTPIDYDERYGLVTEFDQDTGYKRFGYNLFSGRYAIVTIENSFSKGKFEQTLDLVRLHNQEEYDNLTGTARPIGGQNFFRVPDFGSLPMPMLQGFSATGLAAGTLLPGVVNSISAATNGLINQGTGALTGIAGAVVNQGINMATNYVTNQISGAVTSGINLVTDGVKNLFSSGPSISWENIGTGGFEDFAGGGATSGLISGEVSGIPGLSSFGTVSSGDLVNTGVSDMASGAGQFANDLSESVSSGLSDITNFEFNFDFDFNFDFNVDLGGFF